MIGRFLTIEDSCRSIYCRHARGTDSMHNIRDSCDMTNTFKLLVNDVLFPGEFFYEDLLLIYGELP